MKLLNYGSLNFDYVYEVDHFVSPGETLTANQVQRFCGGKGLNQSIALSKAGALVYHAGVVGTDGNALIQVLKDNGVHTEHVRIVEEMSGHAIIQINKQGENCIILFEGANGKNTREQIETVLAAFQKDDILLIQNEINELEELVKIAYEKEMMIVLNPSPMNEKLTKVILDRVSLFLMNEIEGEMITGKKKAKDILDVMQQLYPKARVLLTLGEKGSIYCENGHIQICKSYEVDVVDTTAAGDTYTGYFIASIQQGKTIDEAMKLATAAAAIAVMTKGASDSIPELNTVMQQRETLKIR